MAKHLPSTVSVIKLVFALDNCGALCSPVQKDLMKFSIRRSELRVRFDWFVPMTSFASKSVTDDQSELCLE